MKDGGSAGAWLGLGSEAFARPNWVEGKLSGESRTRCESSELIASSSFPCRRLKLLIEALSLSVLNRRCPSTGTLGTASCPGISDQMIGIRPVRAKRLLIEFLVPQGPSVSSPVPHSFRPPSGSSPTNYPLLGR